MAQLTIQQTFDLAVYHHQAGRLRQAEQLCRQILAQQPEHVDAMHHLGVIAHQAGYHDVAVDLIRRAIVLRPDYPEAYNNLSIALVAIGQFDEAIAACRQAIALKPVYAEADYNLGVALCAKGQLDEAIAAYRQAIAHKPNFAAAHNNLGSVLIDKGQFAEGIAAYRRAIALNADDVDALINLGNVLKYEGQLNEAVAAYRRAITLRPDYVVAHSNLVFTLSYHPDYDAAAILREGRQFDAAQARALTQAAAPHDNTPDPDRRLRIGYVGADFREHCQSFFLLPLLEHHDHECFEIFCYANVPRPDDFTKRIMRCADVWRSICGQNDQEVAGRIRADRIDILVDLTMHMGKGRALLFARKPAPVQVAYLAYPGTTGLSAMDYRFSDPYLDPPGNDDALYSETTLRLPETFWCYDPLTSEPEVNALPVLKNGYVTFGCLNHFCKVQQPALRLWARVLAQVGGSRLLLLCPEGEHRATLQAEFARHGIAPERIEFVPFQPRAAYLQTYHRIDLGLDTLPYNGHTTSLDAMWMGVPIVTRVGSTVVGRAGFSQLANLGLRELVAWSDEDFVRIAADWANNLPRLGELRGSLRHRMERSPVMDAPRFALAMEAAYRQIWVNWCASASTPV